MEFRGNFSRLILPLTCILANAGLPSSTAGEPLQIISGQLTASGSRLPAVGELDRGQRLDLSIGLPLRNRPQLTQFLEQIYNPASPNWHRYLTVEQFTEKFGPAESDYRALINFAETNGFKIMETQPNRMLLVVNATVRQIETVFHVKLALYQHPVENRQFYAPDVEPTIDVAFPVLHVSGLDNYRLTRPGVFNPPGRDHKSLPLNSGGPAGGSGPGGSFRGQDFRKAYVPGVALTGGGQNVGLVEFDGYYGADITNYATQSGLPSVALTNVLVGGFSGTPGGGVNDVFEVTLDIEMVASMAPGLAQIIVYETGSYGLGDQLLNRIATDNQAAIISCSWWFSPNPTTAQIFQEYAAQGQTFFIASQDEDAFNAAALDPVYPPLDYPYAIAVGGTTLTTSALGDWTSEKVWNFNNGTGSGGGISSSFTIPSWQTGIDMTTNRGSTVWRNIPDVACVASGFYVVYNNGATTTGGWGTSFATPLWAGFTALAAQQAAANGHPRLGFLNPVLYQIGQSGYYSSAFHDITVGNNTNSTSPTLFPATPGYDLCTGWGTPKGAALIDLLAPPLTLIVLSAPSLMGGTFQITASGLAFGKTNYLLMSTNFASASWITIATNVANSNRMVISGSRAANVPAQFFRLVERP